MMRYWPPLPPPPPPPPPHPPYFPHSPQYFVPRRRPPPPPQPPFLPRIRTGSSSRMMTMMMPPPPPRRQQQLEPEILRGCVREAERADHVARLLQGLRNALPDSLHPHLDGVIYEIGQTGRHLRDVAERAQVHVARVPQVIDYLNVILPCLSKTLMDITNYYNDTSMKKDSRWRYMYHEMSKELPGTTLPARFIMYNQFLKLLRLLLSRSPNFDFNALESLNARVLELRAVRNIPPPQRINRMQLIRQGGMLGDWEQPRKAHWAESVLKTPPPTRTKFRKSSISPAMSEAYGPLTRLGLLPRPAPDARELLKKSFDDDHVSVRFFLQGLDQAPYVYIRMVQNDEHWVAILGAHELVIKRDTDDDSALVLTRWSAAKQKTKPWARLNFTTWEDMVLFHCTFVALKADSALTLNIHPDEYRLSGESRLFQAQIIDDDYQHSLMVYEDQTTKGLRLHAAVWEGDLRLAPVWTAFIQPQPAMIRKSQHRIWLRDIHPYVFCKTYKARHQRRGKVEAFEIYFVNVEAANRFMDTLVSPTEPSNAATESSDNVTGTSGS